MRDGKGRVVAGFVVVLVVFIGLLFGAITYIHQQKRAGQATPIESQPVQQEAASTDQQATESAQPQAQPASNAPAQQPASSGAANQSGSTQAVLPSGLPQTGPTENLYVGVVLMVLVGMLAAYTRSRRVVTL